MDGAMSNTIPCNLCGEDDTEVAFEAGTAQPARIVRCKRTECGELMYSSPRARPSDADLHEQWNAVAALEGVTTDPNHRYRWRLEKEEGQVKDFQATRKVIQRLYPNGGKMVEVGSGLAYLLRSFKDEGWNVLGIDPWRALPTMTMETHGIETIPATLEQAALPDSSVDVVILLHVIEHVPDPVATLTEINRILKPGGHLVMETPRYDTLMFKLLGKRERSLRCDGHIYFFTFASLKRTYERAGFVEVETKAVGRTLSVERLLHNVGIVLGSKGLQKALVSFARTIGLNKLNMMINLRDMQRVVIRKES